MNQPFVAPPQKLTVDVLEALSELIASIGHSTSRLRPTLDYPDRCQCADCRIAPFEALSANLPWTTAR